MRIGLNLDLSSILKKSDSTITLIDESVNTVNIAGTDYYIVPMQHKGGNSILFKLFEAQEDDDTPSLIMKICKYNYPRREELEKPIHKRFIREIEALKLCRTNGIQNIVLLLQYGKLKIRKDNRQVSGFEYYLFYIMEYADSDLKTYLEQNNLNMHERLGICIEICDSLSKLHAINIYHRDLKPDNILRINNEWKIADLGLITYRNDDTSIDNQ